MSSRSLYAFGAFGVIPLLAGAAFAGQWTTPLPSLHRWAQIDRIPRHHAIAANGVPEPYRTMRNPLPVSRATIAKGATLYATNCRSCHGLSGKGNGPIGRDVSPSPFDIAWLSEMKVSRFDGFMYWTIAEGGVPFGTSMPPYKKMLSPNDIWAVTTYIQAGLPKDLPPR
ncbi:hypothetical protein AWL63_00125 [Sphingomonas panacis]|uniref:Cytochrome c domain-containing protein n=1 Tax=Sphingomonas panacis TaxID=1560345 RepID=A0A1B3Z5C5_9SPHN|nr:cytochrome c [Sphingomonas panacis]AOH82627.1 hypothetical protein AWL63_00125 [Sphingomonas panacis]